MLEGIQNFLFPNSLPSFGFQLPMNLHTNACGDFTLLSAADWANLRGYSELEVFSMHLDSLLCHAAPASSVVLWLVGANGAIVVDRKHSGQEDL